MIYTSQDYSFTKLLDHRLTQYRCPSCCSYDVVVEKMADLVDGPANMMIAEGTMRCRLCFLTERGRLFQIHTATSSSFEGLSMMIRDLRVETGDKWGLAI